MARELAGGGVMRRSSVHAPPATSPPSRSRRSEITLLESRDAPAIDAVLQYGAEVHRLAPVRAALHVLVGAGALHLRALAAPVRALHAPRPLAVTHLPAAGPP